MDKKHPTTEEMLEYSDRRVGEIIDTKFSKFVWKMALFFVLSMVAFAVAWGSLVTKVDTNTENIKELQQGSLAYLTRQQVDDLLGVRDEKLSNIESGIMRLEKKLDNLFK